MSIESRNQEIKPSSPYYKYPIPEDLKTVSPMVRAWVMLERKGQEDPGMLQWKTQYYKNCRETLFNCMTSEEQAELIEFVASFPS